LARLPRRAEELDPSLTEPGCVLGTADFLAPEQAIDARAADARADIYGLGCTLYYLLSAQVPYPGGTATEKLLRHLHEEPQPLEQQQHGVAPALAAVVRKMMARRPDDRYQTMGELLAALSAALDEGSDLVNAGPTVRAPAAATMIVGTRKGTVSPS